ncbi:MAG: hypothetical protein KGZ50_00615 [Peptococcaceae bacterium]|nr:hypothetical protein [Peptococcaceae bacterium]
MGRAERRRKDRRGGPGFSWDKIVVALVAAFFVVSAAVAYFFPLITSRSYAEGSPRIHRIIISRAISLLERQESLEFAYFFTNEAGSTMQFKAKEAGEKITLTDSVDNVPKEFEAGTLPPQYQTLETALVALRAALRDKDFVITHRENEQQFGHKILQVVKRDDEQRAVEGYELYFDADHALDELHFVRRVADDKYIQRVYQGLVAGMSTP